jgi:hypothetical protein
MDIHRAVTDGVTRALGVVGLAGIALIHVLDAPGAFEDAPYRGVLYLLLIAGCIAIGAALVRGGDRRAWAAAAFLPATTIVALMAFAPAVRRELVPARG